MGIKPSRTKGISILILAIMVILSIFVFINSRIYSKTEEVAGRRSFAPAGGLLSAADGSSTVFYAGDLMLEIQSRIIRARSISSNNKWSEQLPGAVAKIANAGDNIIVVDGSKLLSCISRQGKLLWSCSLPYECLELYTQDNGYLLVEYKNNSGCRFDVFDVKGSKRGSALVENAYLLAFSTEGQDMFSISVLDVSSDSVKSKILTYDYKGDIVWANNFDNEVITSLAYEKDGSLLALGSKGIYRYKSNGKAAAKHELQDSIEAAAVSGQRAVLVLRGKGGLSVCCFDSDLGSQGSSPLDKTPEGIYVTGDGFILYDREGFSQYNSKCHVVAAYDSPSDITGVYMDGNDRYYVMSGRKIQLLQCR